MKIGAGSKFESPWPWMVLHRAFPKVVQDTGFSVLAATN